MARDPFGARTLAGDAPAYYRLERLSELGVGRPARLPHTVRVLLESLLRNAGGVHVREARRARARQLARAGARRRGGAVPRRRA